MDPSINQARIDQIIKYDDINIRYECLICDVKLSGEPSALDHLKSKQHREVGARCAIRNLRSSPKSLLDLLPDSVRDAAEAGDISVMESKEIICHICTSPNSGVVTLKAHLLSNSHIKKRDSRPQPEVQGVKVPSPRVSMTFTNPAVQQAISEKIVNWVNANEFQCSLCDLKFSGEISLEQHLDSKKHREVGARLAIGNIRTAPRSLIDKLPFAVKDAAEAGLVTVTDSKDFSCNVCNVSLNGVVSLNDHLVGDDHMKKIATHIMNSSPSCQTPIKSPFSVISPTTNAAPSQIITHLNPTVQQAISEKIVNYINANEFQCNLCDLKFSGEISLEQHLDSKKHREVGARLAIGNFRRAPRSLIDKLPSAVKEAVEAGLVTVTDSKDFRCNVCDVSLNGVVSLNDHLVGDDHKKKNATQVMNSLPSVPPNAGVAPNQISTQLLNAPLHDNPDIARALADGIITETDNKLDPFCCKLCDKKFNSDGPLLDHLKSKKHLQKEKMYLDSRASSPSINDINPTGKVPDSEKTPGTPKKKYSVISDIRGHVYVFNYTFKGTQKSRRGAEHDSDNLRKTFSKMGYSVFIHEDLTGEQTNEALDKIRKKSELNGVDSFIMCFLSHGLDEYTFLANDEDEMNLQMIRRKFTDRKCPYLRGKPKIFFVNYCRGDQMQKKEIEYDSVEAPNDMVTIHAATEGIMARRTPTSGTIFVASLCEVLNAHAREFDLRGIYHELEDKMKERQGTKPMWEDYGFKPFEFNPV